jgi:glycine dehydrogenase subunit 1
MTFVPHTPAQRARMLTAVGVDSIEELLDTIPAQLLLGRSLNVPRALGEVELAQAVQGVLADNQHIPPNRVFAGGGVYPHHVPAVVDELAGRGEFYSAYTPYQPEVSQGMLQCIYEYQSYICMITGMEVSNASGYDGGTVLADAVLMALNAHKGKRRRVVFAPHVDPAAKDVVGTYGLGQQLESATLSPAADGTTPLPELGALLGDDVACVVFQYPNCLGYLEAGLADHIAAAKAAGALAVVQFYPFAAGLLQTPGELGADIVCGEAQCLGSPPGFGGPLLGFIACREQHVRVLPGRLIGRTKCERNGKPGEGFVMTLQAREQHIRRGRATSNICTNEALLALRACIYLGAIGKDGFERLAALGHHNAWHARDQLTQLAGVDDYYPAAAFFNEFTLRFPPGKRDAVYDAALARGMLAGIKPDPVDDPGLVDALTLAFTEVHGEADVAALVACIKEVP